MHILYSTVHIDVLHVHTATAARYARIIEPLSQLIEPCLSLLAHVHMHREPTSSIHFICSILYVHVRRYRISVSMDMANPIAERVTYMHIYIKSEGWV